MFESLRHCHQQALPIPEPAQGHRIVCLLSSTELFSSTTFLPCFLNIQSRVKRRITNTIPFSDYPQSFGLRTDSSNHPAQYLFKTTLSPSECYPEVPGSLLWHICKQSLEPESARSTLCSDRICFSPSGLGSLNPFRPPIVRVRSRIILFYNFLTISQSHQLLLPSYPLVLESLKFDLLCLDKTIDEWFVPNS